MGRDRREDWLLSDTLKDNVNAFAPAESKRVPETRRRYALTAFLLYKNGVIHEDEVMDAHTAGGCDAESQRLRDAAGKWKHGKPRLQGYPEPRQ